MKERIKRFPFLSCLILMLSICGGSFVALLFGDPNLAFGMGEKAGEYLNMEWDDWKLIRMAKYDPASESFPGEMEIAEGMLESDSETTGTTSEEMGEDTQETMQPGEGASSDEAGIGPADRGTLNDMEDPSSAEEEMEEPAIGTEANPAVTSFLTYDPVPVQSRYYRDAGRIGLTTDYPYETVTDDYFDDAAWIGDSRVLGIYDYSGWNSDFYCDNGYCLYSWSKQKAVTCQNRRDKSTLEDAMKEHQYGKIYIMMGMNDCGYASTEVFQEEYRALLDMLAQTQPDATLYLVANLHITRAKDGGEVYTNLNINAKNAAIAECADGYRSFYLDYNDLFTDEEGYLEDGISFDGVHLYASNYDTWTDFFRQHAVLR